MSELLSGLALFLLFAWLGVLALLSTWHDREELRFQVQLFLWAYALRFALSIAIYQLGLVAVLGDEDASGWTGGVGLQQRWAQQGVGLLDLPFVLTAGFGGQHRGYFYLLGAVFYLTDMPYRVSAAALNGF